MNLAFLVAVCSCNVILGENFKSEMGFMEERIERTEADESRKVYMEVMANASRLAVISTVEGEMVKVKNSKVERKKLRMVEEMERLREKRASFYRSGSELAWQVSDTLDQILVRRGYNKQMRPVPKTGGPVTVTVNMNILSIGPIDELRQVYSLDCYFRQTWSDPRLQFNTSGVGQISLDWKSLTKIWRPDTVFMNGQKCYLHKMTTPNRFIRFYPDGRVSYSQRLTVWARCAMHLGKFPFDSQKCPLEIGSFGYHAGDVQYEWAGQAIEFGKFEMAEMALKEFHHGVATGLTNRKLASGFRNDSIAFLTLDFERESGFFLLGIYFPLTLVVVCSWVAFWIVKTDTPSRTSLGIITILSVTKIGFGGKTKPKVGYSTALDIYNIICFAFTFAALFEFVLINFIGMFIQRYKAEEEAKKNKSTGEKKEKSNGHKSSAEADDGCHSEAEQENVVGSIVQGSKKFLWFAQLRSKIPRVPDLLIYDETQYVVDRLDEVSRKLFPLTFLATSVCYWSYYFLLAEDLRSGPEIRQPDVSFLLE